MNRKFFLLILLILVSAISVFYFSIPKQKPELKLKNSSFKALKHWQKADLKVSFQTFMGSCKTFLKQDPNKFVGSNFVKIYVKDWQDVCKRAARIEASSNQAIKAFFEQNFTPVNFYYDRSVDGLFTGYYLPEVEGSLTKTDKFKVPVYARPADLITVNLGTFDSTLKLHRPIYGRIEKNNLIPYHTREEIFKGKINGKAESIAWIESPVDLQFLEIEGSGVIRIDDNNKIGIGYAAQNGQEYTSIAKILIESNLIPKEKASMQGIREYFANNPDSIHKILNQNKSFVFFSLSQRLEALGSQGIALTPGYSLAVDPKFVPLGTPLWLETTIPHKEHKKVPLKRLMVAQDTGGAIKGPVRGDIYWGSGEEATFIAGHMKNMGSYWLLLPNSIVVNKFDHNA